MDSTRISRDCVRRLSLSALRATNRRATMTTPDCLFFITATLALAISPSVLAGQESQATDARLGLRHTQGGDAPSLDSTNAAEAAALPLPAPDPRYRLRSGDVLELNFPFVPTFTQTVTVQPDGYITL